MVGAVSATNDAGEVVTYTLFDDAGGRFGVSGTNLIVADGTKLDFESATSHQVTVRATDLTASSGFEDSNLLLSIRSLICWR